VGLEKVTASHPQNQQPPGISPGGRCWSSRKPSSVSPLFKRRWSSVWDGRRRPPLAAYPRLCRCGSHLAAYLALLRLGVTLPPLLPAARWALTPPFHPYPSETLRPPPGGLFSVALSVAFRRPGVTWQSTLWSSDFPREPCGPATIALDQCLKIQRERGTVNGHAIQLATPTLANPRRAWSRNGWSSGSAVFHWVMTCRYSAWASANRPSRSYAAPRSSRTRPTIPQRASKPPV